MSMNGDRIRREICNQKSKFRIRNCTPCLRDSVVNSKVTAHRNRGTAILSVIRKQFALPIFMLALAGLAAAQTQSASKVYRDGNSWVEEITGTLPASH